MDLVEKIAATVAICGIPIGVAGWIGWFNTNNRTWQRAWAATAFTGLALIVSAGLTTLLYHVWTEGGQ